MSELTDFLLARIAELEADPWGINDGGFDLDIAYSDRAVGQAERAALDAQRARWEAYVRAECEAKRRIVRRSLRAIEASGMNPYAPVLFDVASVYADHPDYREEWKP